MSNKRREEQEENFTDEDYQFLLDDIEEAIAEGNRKYGYGEPGYIGTDGYFHAFPDNVILPESNPKRFRYKSKTRLRPQIHYRVKRRTKPVPRIKPIVKGFRD
jgi:hypothetical protein